MVSRKRRAGFTLVELLVVMAIILLVAAVSLPTVLSLAPDQRLSGAAGTVKATLDGVRDQAAARGFAGFRLEPDPAWELVRLADMTIDPAYPLAYSRIVPLEEPPAYHEGLASVHTDGFPVGFTPPVGRLVLEEAHYLADDPTDTTHRQLPTSWFWNVRVGETIEFLGKSYTVTGPMVATGPDNSEGFVNVGPPGTVSPLDRGDGPREFLYLCNRLDDTRIVPVPPVDVVIAANGTVDDGWNGIDDDLDGSIDEDDEWETETWAFILPGPSDPPTTGAAVVTRRPIAAPARAVELPAGTVIDATGWAAVGFDSANGLGDLRQRSQVLVNLYTGAVDVVFDGQGQADFPTWYGRPAAGTFGRPFVHLWIAERSDVAAPVATKGDARLVSLDRFTGRVVVTEADAADPASAFERVERGSR